MTSVPISRCVHVPPAYNDLSQTLHSTNIQERRRSERRARHLLPTRQLQHYKITADYEVCFIAFCPEYLIFFVERLFMYLAIICY